AGVSLFLAYQCALALWRLASRSGGMDNKFSSLAKEEFLQFLVAENLRMLPAYLLLSLAGALLVQPAASWWTSRSRFRAPWTVALRGLVIASFLHSFCTLRLIDTRPYFLHDASFGHGYYRLLDIIPA